MKINRYYIASLLWAACIIALTLTPGKSMPNTKLFTYDKLGHAAIFLIQAYLFVSAVYFDKKSVTKSLLWGLLIATGYGLLIEIGQEFIPDRGMEAGDLIANGLGSVAGVGIFYMRLKLKKT